MAKQYVHTCLRVADPAASVRFYEALGFEARDRLNFKTAFTCTWACPAGATRSS